MFQSKKTVISFCVLLVLMLAAGLTASGQGNKLSTSPNFENFISNDDQNYNFWHSISQRAASEAWNLMGDKPSDMIVLTNAGYAVIDNCTTEAGLDGLMEATGCTAGRSNLLRVQTARNQPLWYFFYDTNTGKGVYCEFDSEKTVQNMDKSIRQIPADTLFSKLVMEQVNAESLFNNPEEWNEKLAEDIFNGNEFRIVNITNAIAKGAPFDLVNCMLFHDHYCPGVTSGYLLANYLEKNFPLRAGESYYVISTPIWCKDDALQVLLNTTPGKRGMAVLPLSTEMRENLKPEAESLAGIYFRHNSRAQEGQGILLGFNWPEELSREGFGWEWRLEWNLWLLDNLEKPEMFVDVINTFELEEDETPDIYAHTGVNVLEILDLLDD